MTTTIKDQPTAPPAEIQSIAQPKVIVMVRRGGRQFIIMPAEAD